jgi:phosphatidylserine decarboxylase
MAPRRHCETRGPGKNVCLFFVYLGYLATDMELSGLSLAERLNFLLTNRVPRRTLTLFMGWFSKIENPLVCWFSISIWKLFADDLRLFEARKQHFKSVHDCFVRELKAGARSVNGNSDCMVSPCDAIIGEFGDVDGLEVIQAKGFPYTLDDLLGSQEAAAAYRDGRFVTLRLKSSMYHRFHAPCSSTINEIRYISGDTWNVNPIALKVVERLFCKNERVVIPLQVPGETAPVTLVAVAAIIVASVRIHGLKEPLNLRYRGSNQIPCDLALAKGDEIGYFEHGSTIIMLTSREYRFADGIMSGQTIRMGEPLMLRNEFVILT